MVAWNNQNQNTGRVKARSTGRGIFDEADVVSRYTRAQAIEDGVLVDLTARFPDICNAMLNLPMAVTSRVWSEVICGEQPESEIDTDSIRVRVATFLMAFSKVVGEAKSLYAAGKINLRDVIYWIVVNNRGDKQKVWTKCHGGDNSESVLTTMMRNED